MYFTLRFLTNFIFLLIITNIIWKNNNILQTGNVINNKIKINYNPVKTNLLKYNGMLYYYLTIKISNDTDVFLVNVDDNSYNKTDYDNCELEIFDNMTMEEKIKTVISHR